MENETTKPLTIRGDRLLLALDVLRFILRTCYKDCPKVVESYVRNRACSSSDSLRFSREVTLALLRERFSFKLPECWRAQEHDQYCDNMAPDPLADGPVGHVYEFIQEQFPSLLQRNEFRAQSILECAETLGRAHLNNGRMARSLFSAIASGDLTEADFQEVT